MKFESAKFSGIIIAFTMIYGTACKEKAAAPAPAKKPALSGDEGLQGGGEGIGGGTTGDSESDQLSIELEDSSEDFKYEPGDSINIKFKLKGAPAGGVIVGLADTPSGGTLKKSGSTVTFTWDSPEKGTHKFKFLLRDQKACEEAESAAKCKIDEDDFGEISAKEYDTTSESYTLEIGKGSSANTSNTSNTGNNSQMISQITSLLGSGGGGADISKLLQGLGGGQLQQLLGLLQGGGGGLDIKQLLPLLQGGITLKGDEQPTSGTTKP